MFTPFAFIQPVTTVAPIVPTVNYLLVGGSFTLYNVPLLTRIVKIDGNGDIDNSFNMGGGFANVPFDIKQQPDGKYIVVGAFTVYSGSASNRIVRLNHNGTKDTSFNGGSEFNLVTYAVSPQSNNSNIVVGAFTQYSGSTQYYITKVLPSGAIDNSFNVGLGFNSTVINDVITQADGKVIVGGSFTQYSSSNNYITRTDLSGSYNAGPGTNFNTGIGFNGQVFTYATQSDGKIIAGGLFTTYSGSSTNTTRIIRLNPDGTQDTSFVTGVGFNSDVNALQIQSDGKIIVVGNFTTYSGSSLNRIVRLNTNGTRDTGFNVGTGFGLSMNKIIIQSDQKVLISGQSSNYSGSTINYLTRLNTNGTIDTTLNIGTGFGGAVSGLALQPDGKIIAGGSFTTYSSSANSAIVRINTNGTKDTTFNMGAGFDNVPYGITLEPTTNKIVVIGSFTTYSGSSTNTTRIIRLNPDGTRDTSFVTGTGLSALTAVPSHLSIESDGKIYVGSNFTTYSGSTVNRFVRINPSGTLDTTFPYQTTSNSANFGNTVRTLFISGSNIYFGGDYITYRATNRILRLNTDGTQDTTFAIGEGFGTGEILCLVTQSDGKIIVTGNNWQSYSGSSTINYIVRLNTDGTRDTTLNAGAGFNNTVTSATVQPDGKIVAIGTFTTYSGSTSNRIVRINPSGTLDTTFNVGTGIDNVSATARASRIISTPDNKVYVTTVGMTTYSGSNIGNLVKINSSGSIDTTFGTTSSFSFNNTGRGFYALASPGGYSLIQSGSSVIVGGQFLTYKNTAFPNGGMIDTTGAISSSFNIGGGFSTTVRTWATQSDGKILAGGGFLNYSSSNSAYIIRLNTNGTIDTTFNIGVGFNNVVTDIRIQSDGKIIAAGQFTTYSGSTSSGIIRLNTNGTRDTTFNVGTGFTTAVDIRQCRIQSDGKIIAVGGFTTYSGSTTNRIVRINTDGTRDTTFNVGTGFGSIVEAAVIQSDGKIVTTGQFLAYSGSTQNYITRVNTNGTRDTTFNIGTGLNANGHALVLQSDEKIICANASTTYSGSTARYIIRINSNGTLDTTFNANVTSGTSTVINTANGLVIDSDGKIYWGSSFTTLSGSFTPNRIVRLNTNGSVDETFNQAFPNFINDTGKGANSTVQAILLL